MSRRTVGPPRAGAGPGPWSASHGPGTEAGGPGSHAIPSADPGARPEFFDPHRPLARELTMGVTDAFTLAAVGDCVVSRPMSGYLRDQGFASVMKLVTSAGVRYANLETVIFDINAFRGHPYSFDADWPLVSHPWVAEDLAALGFQVLSRANNHALDWGIEGMRETSRWLDAVGLVHAGTGERRGLARAPRYLEAPQGRIALVSFTSSYRPTSDALPDRGAAPGRPGVSALGVSPIELVPQALFDALKATPGAGVSGQPRPDVAPRPAAPRPGGDAKRITRFGITFKAAPVRGTLFDLDLVDVAEILLNIRQGKENSDFVMAAIHAHQSDNGYQFGSAILQPAGFLAPLAKAAIDAGASAFITTGNHNIGPVEVYQGKPIVYGIGNFFWSDTQEPIPQDLYQAPDYRARAERAFEHPERMTDADLTALLNAEGGFANRFTFQSYIAMCRFSPGLHGGMGGLTDFRLYPITLRYGERLTWSGIPDVPGPAESVQILSDIRACSLPLGTVIEIVADDGPWVYGRVALAGGGRSP
ncbi:MAG: CapA family protein [Streptosporangiaceae bacterium]